MAGWIIELLSKRKKWKKKESEQSDAKWRLLGEKKRQWGGSGLETKGWSQDKMFQCVFVY